MPYINHINIADFNNNVYCRKLDRVVTLDENQQQINCFNCKFLSGFAQGQGVECYWNDPRPNLGDTIYATMPGQEASNVQASMAKYPIKDVKLTVKGK